MQSSNQPSPEQQERQSDGMGEAAGQEGSPLYEFPADYTLLQNVASPADDTPEASQEARKEQAAGVEIQPGLVYPPPPSFYQNMQAPAASAFLSPQQPSVLPPPGSIPVYPGAADPDPRSQPGTQVPPYAQPPFFPLPPPQPPAKKSRRWIWIVISILSAALLLSCGLCSWALYTIINTTAQSASGVIHVANDYYQHIQNQEYDAAYNDLQVGGLTHDVFVQQAQQSDTQYGPVMSYMVESSTPAVSSMNGFQYSRYDIIMNISRNKLTYRVLLTVDNTNGSWKITAFDKI